MEGPYSLSWVRIWFDPILTSKAPLVVSWIDRFGRQHSNMPQTAELILTYWRHIFAGGVVLLKTAWRRIIKHDYASRSFFLVLPCYHLPSKAKYNASSLSTNNGQRLIICMHDLKKTTSSLPRSWHYLKYAQAQTKIITRRDYIYFPAARYPRDISQQFDSTSHFSSLSSWRDERNMPKQCFCNVFVFSLHALKSHSKKWELSTVEELGTVPGTGL